VEITFRIEVVTGYGGLVLKKKGHQPSKRYAILRRDNSKAIKNNPYVILNSPPNGIGRTGRKYKNDYVPIVPYFTRRKDIPGTLEMSKEKTTPIHSNNDFLCQKPLGTPDSLLKHSL